MSYKIIVLMQNLFIFLAKFIHTHIYSSISKSRFFFSLWKRAIDHIYGLGEHFDFSDFEGLIPNLELGGMNF